MATRPILVGYDGSDDGNAALDWAIREGRSTGKPVVALYVAPDLAAMEAATASLAGVALAPDQLVPDGSAVLQQAVDRAAESGLEITTATATGAPARVLVERSADADLLVVGSRGLGAGASLVVGSSVIHVTSHAKCPVVVAQANPEPTGPVIVGTDGSEASLPAVAWAIQHADANGLPVEILTISKVPTPVASIPYVASGKSGTESDAAIAAVEQAIAPFAAQHPDVPITISVLQGRPGPTLVEASGRARETVVGTRGRGAFLGMLLGSTSQALLHHARGTVVVVPHFEA